MNPTVLAGAPHISEVPYVIEVAWRDGREREGGGDRKGRGRQIGI